MCGRTSFQTPSGVRAASFFCKRLRVQVDDILSCDSDNGQECVLYCSDFNAREQANCETCRTMSRRALALTVTIQVTTPVSVFSWNLYPSTSVPRGQNEFYTLYQTLFFRIRHFLTLCRAYATFFGII